MKTAITFLFAISGLLSYSQIKGVVVDSQTGEAIPYANIWLLGKTNGTSSEKTGAFYLPSYRTGDTITISSIGYAPLEVKPENTNDIVVRLKAKRYELEAFIVKPRKKRHKLVVDPINRWANTISFVCSSTPWIVTKHFPFRDFYEKTPFIKEVRIHTKGEVDSSTINFHLYTVSANNKPCKDMLEENLLVKIRKGVHVTTINLENEKILFPSNGLFVGVEWLIINSNRYQTIFTDKELRKKSVDSYSPKILAEKKKGEEIVWLYTGGKWAASNFLQNQYDSSYYLVPKIELILTD